MGLWDFLGLLHMGFESWLENEIYYLFSKLINFMNKIILKNLELIFKSRKILRDLQKFGKISKRHFGTWWTQIKYLELIKRFVGNLEHKDEGEGGRN